MSRGFLEYVSDGTHLRHGVARQLAEGVRRVEAWIVRQRMWRLFGSSLLMVYEGDADTIRAGRAHPPRVRVIDFANAWPYDATDDEIAKEKRRAAHDGVAPTAGVATAVPVHSADPAPAGDAAAAHAVPVSEAGGASSGSRLAGERDGTSGEASSDSEDGLRRVGERAQRSYLTGLRHVIRCLDFISEQEAAWNEALSIPEVLASPVELGTPTLEHVASHAPRFDL